MWLLSYEMTTLRLQPELLREIDRVASERGVERSVVIREVLRLGLQEFKIRLAIEKYQKGGISFGKAAEIAGVGYREMFLEMRRRNVAVRYGKERFLREIAELW